MHISIGNKTEEYMKILGIVSFPFTESELKEKYRYLVKLHHPDKTKEKDEEKIKIINSSYEHLKNLAISNVLVSDEERQAQINKFEENQDIFKLWETCTSCKGSGKKEIPMTKICTECNTWDYEHSFFFLRRKNCRACKGTGKFKQKSGKIVDCFKCSGTGWYGMKKCSQCNNTGFIINTNQFVNCGNCNGLGKIEVKPFNPVIRKGAVL